MNSIKNKSRRKSIETECISQDWLKIALKSLIMKIFIPGFLNWIWKELTYQADMEKELFWQQKIHVGVGLIFYSKRVNLPWSESKSKLVKGSSIFWKGFCSYHNRKKFNLNWKYWKWPYNSLAINGKSLLNSPDELEWAKELEYVVCGRKP